MGLYYTSIKANTKGSIAVKGRLLFGLEVENVTQGKQIETIYSIDLNFCRDDMANRSRLYSYPRGLALAHFDKSLVACDVFR